MCVHGIEFIELTRIYGYHGHSERFAKISLINPLCKKAVVQILEAHLGYEVLEHRTEYIQQFLQDYNLRGMGWCEATKFTCRCPPAKDGNGGGNRGGSAAAAAAGGGGGGGGSGGAAGGGGGSYDAECGTEWPRLLELHSPTHIMHTPGNRHSVCQHEASIEAADILIPGVTKVGASQDGVLDPGLATMWQEERDYRSRVGAWNLPFGEKARLFPPSPAVDRTEIPYADLTHNEKKAEDELKDAIEKDAATVAAAAGAIVAAAAAAGVGGWDTSSNSDVVAPSTSSQEQAAQRLSQWRYTPNELLSQESTGAEAMDILQGFHTDVDADFDMSQRAGTDLGIADNDGNGGQDALLEADEDEEEIYDENEEGPSFWNSQPEFDGTDIFASQFERGSQESNASTPASQGSSVSGRGSQQKGDTPKYANYRSTPRTTPSAAAATPVSSTESNDSPEIAVLEPLHSAAPLFSGTSSGAGEAATHSSDGRSQQQHQQKHVQTRVQNRFSNAARNSFVDERYAENDAEQTTDDENDSDAGDHDGGNSVDGGSGGYCDGCEDNGVLPFSARLHANAGVLQKLAYRTPSPQSNSEVESSQRYFRRLLPPPQLLQPRSPAAEVHQDNDSATGPEDKDEESIPASLNSVWQGSHSPNLDSSLPLIAARTATVATTATTATPSSSSGNAAAAAAAAAVSAVAAAAADETTVVAAEAEEARVDAAKLSSASSSCASVSTSVSGMPHSASPDLAASSSEKEPTGTWAPSSLASSALNTGDCAVYDQSTEEQKQLPEQNHAHEEANVAAESVEARATAKHGDQEPVRSKKAVRWVCIDGDDVMVQEDYSDGCSGGGSIDIRNFAEIASLESPPAGQHHPHFSAENEMLTSTVANEHHSSCKETAKNVLKDDRASIKKEGERATKKQKQNTEAHQYDGDVAGSIIDKLSSPVPSRTSTGWWLCGKRPPTYKELEGSMVACEISEQLNPPAFYSMAADDPKSRAGLKIAVINGVQHSPPRARRDRQFDPQYVQMLIATATSTATATKPRDTAEAAVVCEEEAGKEKPKPKTRKRKRRRDALLNARQQTNDAAVQAGFRYASQSGSAVWTPVQAPPTTATLLATMSSKRLKRCSAGGGSDLAAEKGKQKEGARATLPKITSARTRCAAAAVRGEAGGGGGEGGRIAPPTQKNSFGFEHGTQTQPDLDETYMTVLTVEIHATSSQRGMLPNPETPADEVVLLCYHLLSPGGIVERGMIYVDVGGNKGNQKNFLFMKHKTTMHRVESERGLFDFLIEMVADHDPDILVGFEIDRGSWAYLVRRAHVLDLDLTNEMSRVHADDRRIASKDNAGVRYKANRTSEIEVTGRIVINLWRVMKADLTKAKNYTYQNIVYHVLHQRVAWYPHTKLDQWWRSADKASYQTHYCLSERDAETTMPQRWKVAQHTMERAIGCANMMEETNFVVKNSEFARLFGIQFEDVLYRGSQQRVEAQMFRLARRNGFVIASPNDQSVKSMRAARWVP